MEQLSFQVETTRGDRAPIIDVPILLCDRGQCPNSEAIVLSRIRECPNSICLYSCQTVGSVAAREPPPVPVELSGPNHPAVRYLRAYAKRAPFRLTQLCR